MTQLTSEEKSRLEGFLLADLQGIEVVTEYDVTVNGHLKMTFDNIKKAEDWQWGYVRAIAKLDDAIFMNRGH